ncbi:MAG: glycosyltransferase [Chloroflexota bacterium]
MLSDNHNKPFVSVIIPTYNDNQSLETCLNALDSQTYPKTHYEIIVVDNGSDIPPTELVQNIDNATLLSEPKKSSYAARNTGIDHAQGDIFAFIDSDCIPNTYWLENGVEHVVTSDVLVAVGGAVKVFFKNANAPTWVELYEKVFAFPIDSVKKRYFPTCNLFTNCSTLETVGKFNENLKSGGDIDWGNRAYNKGVHLKYAENIQILHPARRTLKQHANKVRRIAGGQIKRAKESRTSWYLKRIVYYDFLPPIGSVRKLITYKELNIQQKLKVFAIILWTRTVAIREKIKVGLLAKTPVR